MFNKMKCYVCGADMELSDTNIENNVQMAVEQFGRKERYFLCSKCYSDYTDKMNGAVSRVIKELREDRKIWEELQKAPVYDLNT